MGQPSPCTRHVGAVIVIPNCRREWRRDTESEFNRQRTIDRYLEVSVSHCQCGFNSRERRNGRHGRRPKIELLCHRRDRGGGGHFACCRFPVPPPSHPEQLLRFNVRQNPEEHQFDPQLPGAGQGLGSRLFRCHFQRDAHPPTTTAVRHQCRHQPGGPLSGLLNALQAGF